MDPVSNIDHLVLALRARLRERSRPDRARAAELGRPAGPASGRLESLTALAGVKELTDGQLKRAVIQNVLAEHFGKSLVNQAGFQQMVGRVTEEFERDGQLGPLMSRVIADLRAAAA